MKIKFVKFLLLMVIAVSAQAQNKVVVIPLGGNDGPFADIYLATLDSDGTINAKTTGVLNAAKTFTGSYRIFYDRDDISTCFATGTIADLSQALNLNSQYGIIAITALSPGSGGIGVSMQVRDESGVLADRTFTVQLICPK